MLYCNHHRSRTIARRAALSGLVARWRGYNSRIDAMPPGGNAVPSDRVDERDRFVYLPGATNLSVCVVIVRTLSRVTGPLQVSVRRTVQDGHVQPSVLQALSPQQVLQDRNASRVHPHRRGARPETTEDRREQVREEDDLAIVRRRRLPGADVRRIRYSAVSGR